jgi:hypothetical protein
MVHNVTSNQTRASCAKGPGEIGFHALATKLLKHERAGLGLRSGVCLGLVHERVLYSCGPPLHCVPARAALRELTLRHLAGSRPVPCGLRIAL